MYHPPALLLDWLSVCLRLIRIPSFSKVPCSKNIFWRSLPGINRKRSMTRLGITYPSTPLPFQNHQNWNLQRMVLEIRSWWKYCWCKMFRTAEKRPAGSFHIFNASAEHFKVPSTLGEKYRRNLGKKRFFLKSGTHDLETPMCIFYMHVRITTRIDIYSYCVLQCGIFKSVLIHNMHIYIYIIYIYIDTSRFHAQDLSA